MSTSTIPVTDNPTLDKYQCGSGCGTITFSWGRRMPEGGRLGTVTIGRFVNKPIQVFNAQPINNGLGGTDWRFQAQDGTFLGHMYVSPRKGRIQFANFRPSDQFPLVSCSIRLPDPGDNIGDIPDIP